ncbi:OmpA family protein [candidate division FCPU426 bacterium]|nr:OmpA family protein [candidate division FCPU426 bacterium]
MKTKNRAPKKYRSPKNKRRFPGLDQEGCIKQVGLPVDLKRIFTGETCRADRRESNRAFSLILAWLLILFPGGSVQAAPLEEAGTSAAVLLAQPGSARLLALGGGGAAAARGQEGMWWNPAALASYPFFNLELSYRRHWSDTELGFASLAVPTPWGTAGVGLVYAQTLNIEGYDQYGQAGAFFATQDISAKLGYACHWGGFSLGAAAGYVQQDLHTVRVRGWGGDLGLRWEFYPGVCAGASLLHLGATEVKDPLCREARCGFSARIWSNAQVSYDLVVPRDSEMYLGGGLEYYPLEYLCLRAGIRSGPDHYMALGALSLLSLGAGLAWSDFFIDYVFQPSALLGNVHHLSFGYRFSGQAPAPASAPAPQPAAAPRLKIESRHHEGRMVFTPPAGVRTDAKVKGFRFLVKDPDGKIVRTFNYAGQAAPRQLVWDGRDEQGKKVPQTHFTFAFEYITDKGVKTKLQDWPGVLPVRKLRFARGGAGVAPEAIFQFTGEREQVRYWQLQIRDRKTGQAVRAYGQSGPLPAHIQWDGRDEQGQWAPPDSRYSYRLILDGQEKSQAVIDKDIIPVPAKMLAGKNGKKRFKIMEILFDFNAAQISAAMGDKIEKAVEIYKHYRTRADMQIQGHADEVGNAWVNYNISRKRALEVKAHMCQLGVDEAEKVDIAAYGKDRPLFRGRQEQLRAKNRRVEIKIELTP